MWCIDSGIFCCGAISLLPLLSLLLYSPFRTIEQCWRDLESSDAACPNLLGYCYTWLPHFLLQGTNIHHDKYRETKPNKTPINQSSPAPTPSHGSLVLPCWRRFPPRPLFAIADFVPPAFQAAGTPTNVSLRGHHVPGGVRAAPHGKVRTLAK